MGNQQYSNQLTAGIGLAPSLRLKDAMSKAALWRQVYGSPNQSACQNPIRKGSTDSLTDSDSADYMTTSLHDGTNAEQGAGANAGMSAKDVNRYALWRSKWFQGDATLKNVTRGKVSLK